MMKKVIDKRKRSKTLSEVKSANNINKNLQSSLEVSPVRKEVCKISRLCMWEIESFRIKER